MAKLKRPNGETETFKAAYLAGCDGAHSRVRELIGAGFPGGTYEHTFYVADITGDGPVINGDLNLAMDNSDFLAVFPLKGKGRARLIGTIRESEDRKLQWKDVSQDILRRLQLDVDSVNWFSSYRVHHRVASFFRKGRAFLLGDAAHVHSPVGGQGMNTGIGDAVNLGWKFEAVLRRGAPDTILDTYEKERIGFARRLVATTDRAFEFVNRRGGLATFVRTKLVPLIMPSAFHNRAVRRFIWKSLSQTLIRYRDSALSTGAMGHLHSGDRLPWLKDQDNFTPLSSLDWQLQCFGLVPQKLADWSRRTGIPYRIYSPEQEIRRDTLCLIRPDGYVGWIGQNTDIAGLSRYATQWRIA